MRKIFSLFFLVTIYQLAYSQLQVDWQNCFGGEKDDKVNDLVSTGDGFFVLGSYGIHVNHPIYNLQYDVWLIKTDLTGNILWEKKYGGSKDDLGVNIESTSDGNFIIVAQSSSNDYDLSNSPYPTSINYWIYKINPSGDILWSKIVGGNGDDSPKNAIITSDGGLIAVGKTTSDDGDVSSYYGAWDLWAIKLDSTGETVWDYTIGTEGFDWADVAYEDNEGNILIGGTTTFEGNGNVDCEPYSEWGESLLIKFDSELNLLWQQCYGGSLDELIFCISQTSNGYAISHSTESDDGDVSNSGFHGNIDVWVTEVDTLGNILWSECYGGTYHEQPTISFKESNGDLTLFCNTNSHDGDVIGNLSAPPDSDIWVLRTDSTGNIKWQQCLGGIGDESIGLSVKKNDYNSYVIAATTFASNGTGEIDCNITSLNYNDIWFFEIVDTTIVAANKTHLEFWNLYPNPASDYITIEFNNQQGDWKSAILFDCMGRSVLKHPIHLFENKITLPLNDLPSGFYYASLTGQNGMTTFKKLVLIR